MLLEFKFKFPSLRLKKGKGLTLLGGSQYPECSSAAGSPGLANFIEGQIASILGFEDTRNWSLSELLNCHGGEEAVINNADTP